MKSFLRIIFAFALAVNCWSAHAFERPFPANAKRGVMSPGFFPELTLNNQTRRFAANVQIRNAINLIQTPTSLESGRYWVNYVESNTGEITRIWILTPEEARMKPPTGPLPQDETPRQH